MKNILKKIFNNTFKAKPLQYTKWEQIVLKLIDGELEIIKKSEYTIDFNYNKNLYTIWIGNTDNPKFFGTFFKANDEVVNRVIQDKTQIRPEIQEKLKVCWKLTDDDILQKFEEKYFKL